MTPTVLLDGNNVDRVVEKAAQMTVRYSDAPKDIEVDVRYVGKDVNIIKVRAARDEEIESLRI